VVAKKKFEYNYKNTGQVEREESNLMPGGNIRPIVGGREKVEGLPEIIATERRGTDLETHTGQTEAADDYDQKPRNIGRGKIERRRSRGTKKRITLA